MEEAGNGKDAQDRAAFEAGVRARAKRAVSDAKAIGGKALGLGPKKRSSKSIASKKTKGKDSLEVEEQANPTFAGAEDEDDSGE